MDGESDAHPAPPAGDEVASPLAPRRPGARLLAAVGAAVAVGVALFLLYRVLHRYSLHQLVAAVADIPTRQIALAALCAAASYATLSLFDFLGVLYTGRRLPYRKVLLASFTSLSIGHSIGLAALSTGAIRYRFYRSWGLGRGDVARIIVFCAVTAGLGLLGLDGVALLAAPALLGAAVAAPLALVRAAGAVCLAAIPLYLVLALVVKPQLRLRRWRLRMPPPRLALAQVVLGPVNFLFVAATLYQVLEPATGIGFLAVAAVYGVANLLSILAHVPGGWGVLETAVILVVPDADPIGALVAFRVVYFLVPFCLGLVLLAAAEARRYRVRSPARGTARTIP
jgi:uncharacterized membrane protein YbhN (UPF0104 family)